MKKIMKIIIPCKNIEKYENHRIPLQNYENNVKHKIQCENRGNH